MTIEHLNCRVDRNFEVNFRVNGAIGTIAPKWDLILFGKWTVFINNNMIIFKHVNPNNMPFNKTPISRLCHGLICIHFSMLSFEMVGFRFRVALAAKNQEE